VSYHEVPLKKIVSDVGQLRFPFSTDRNARMSILERIRTNFSDISTFGPSFLWRHSPRVTGAHTAKVSLRDHGSIHLRAGESDVAAVREIFGRGQYNIEGITPLKHRITKRYKEIIDRGKTPVIVDAGANIGAASIWFARHYGQADIVAIEPEPENFRVLAKNAGSETRIRPFCSAIGSAPGFVSIHTDGLGWATRTERAVTGIPVITVEQAVSTVRNGELFMAKIDIEGFEDDLFATNVDWLDEVFVVFVEPHDWMLPGQGTSRTFQREMGKRPFEVYITGEILTYVRLPILD
jgi:FkbM family methyltransferase